MTELRELRSQIRGFTTKSDTAYTVLREAILSGTLAPGESLQAKEIAKELDMSVIPVREGLSRLEQDGLISIRPHVGAAVRELANEELEEFMLIRSELEALATRLAAPTITDDTIARLEELVSEMDESENLHSPERYGKLNREFHLTLYRSNRFQRLYHYIESLWDHVPRARSVFALVPNYMHRSQHEHRELLDALKRRDGDAAERVMRAQKANALKAMLAVGTAPTAAESEGPPAGKGRAGEQAENDQEDHRG